MAKQRSTPDESWDETDPDASLERRILMERPEQSCSVKQNKTDHDLFDNMLIHGDNRWALQALESDFTGKVKCIYIDPPYNTGNVFQHYDDGMEHTAWLALMRDRLSILRTLLREDGVILVQIDDHEQAYLKVLMDELFGAENFVATISVQMSVAAGLKTTHADRTILKICEYIHVYARERRHFKIANIDYIRSAKASYDLATRRDRIILNPDEPVEQWQFETVRSRYTTEIGRDNYRHIDAFVDKYAAQMYTFIENKSSRQYWDRLKPEEQAQHHDRVRHLTDEKTRYQYAYNRAVLLPYYPTTNDGNLWLNFHNLGRTAESEGGVRFKNGKKPEKLLERIIGLFTQKGELVLDAFAGSGTTGAVAHKMGRRWICIELRDHCETHIAQRLTRVIRGEDATGVTESTQWKGGGGFRFYTVVPEPQSMERSMNTCVVEGKHR